MARTASTPFVTFDSMELAKENKPEQKMKKDGTEAAPFNLYQISLPTINKTDGTEFDGREVFVWSRSPTNAIGQTITHYGLCECILAEKPERTAVPPAVRAKRAFAKLGDDERRKLLEELMGSSPTNGDSESHAESHSESKRSKRNK